MGLTNIPKVDPDSSIAAALMDMYQSMGDALAQQYGGSAAHNTVCSFLPGLTCFYFVHGAGIAYAHSHLNPFNIYIINLFISTTLLYIRCPMSLCVCLYRELIFQFFFGILPPKANKFNGFRYFLRDRESGKPQPNQESF